MSPRPGITKVRRIPHLTRTTKSFVRTLDGAVKEWVELADVVSEGGPSPSEGGGTTYYGTSSVMLEWTRSTDPELCDPSAFGAIANDPHIRLRVLRIARREAEVRAGGDLGIMRADIAVHSSARGVVLTVEVEARVASTVKISRR